MEACPICFSETTFFQPFGDNRKEVSTIDCTVCEKFEVNNADLKRIENNIAPTDRYNRNLLSHWIRKNFNGKDRVRLRNYKNILETFSFPKPKEQADNLILWIGDNAKSPDSEVNSFCKIVSSIIGASSSWNVKYVASHLNDNRLIKFDYDSGDSFQANLTFNGWERYDELKRSNKDSRLAFMAMKFGNKELDEVYREVIIKAVAETGYEIRTLLEEKRAGLIDDKLRVEIRRSRFLISDLTDENGGAYWEAGFAEGLGLPVIYICKERKFDELKTHFDTNHHLTVKWNKDNLQKFADELKATIRATLPAEAKMED